MVKKKVKKNLKTQKIHRKKIKYASEDKKLKENCMYRFSVHKKLDSKSKRIKKTNTKKFHKEVMSMGKELRKLEGFLKKLDKKLVRKLRSVRDEDQLELARYLVISKLKERHLDLVHAFGEHVRDYRKEGSNYDYLKHKVQQVPARIKIFETDFDKREFKKLITHLDRLRVEVNNV